MIADREKRIQNVIAGSRLLLPVMLAYTCFVWVFAGAITNMWWPQFLLFFVSCCFVMEINNSNAFLRVYSRMMVSCFAVLTLMTGLFPNPTAFLAQTCFVLFLFFLFRGYQDSRCPGTMFYAFIFLSLSSMAAAPVLYMVPVAWILMTFNVQATGWRSFCGSLLGLLLPYFYWGCYMLYMRDGLESATAHFSSLVPQGVESMAQLPVARWLFLIFCAIYMVCGYLHFVRYSYQDKVKVKMMFYTMLWLDLCLIALIVVFPSCYAPLALMLCGGVCGPMSHFIMFTHNRPATVMFFIMTAAALTLTLYNAFMI